jgi:hypothetical protein
MRRDALLEAHRKDTGAGNWRDERTHSAFDVDGVCKSIQFLPQAVREWAQVDDIGPVLNGTRMSCMGPAAAMSWAEAEIRRQEEVLGDA